MPGGYANLYNQNPFWYYSGSRKSGEGVTAEELGISLVQIQELGDRARARIKTRTTTKWFDEGEPFEEFVLESIDPDDGTVVVYAESVAQRITLELP